VTEAGPTASVGQPPRGNALAVFANRPFLLLWLSQLATQVGGNMVLYGLTVLVFQKTGSNSAVSALLLTFLVPAVLFSAWAGVYVDRYDRRVILVITNVLRAAAFVALFFASDYLLLIYALNIFVSTVTVFFAPAEAAMIPQLVPRSQLIAANGVFTLTLNASFALGFALLGPLVVRVAGADAVLIAVAVLYLLAAVFCFTLPTSRSAGAPAGGSAGPLEPVSQAEQAVESALGQLREGLAYIRAHREIGWSLVYLGITASLIGVLGVLGPDFATEALGLDPQDFVVVVLPLGFGIVTGVLILNGIRTLVPRRRLMEGGLIALGILLAILSVAGPVSRLLQEATDPASGIVDLSTLTSLLAVVVAIGFLAGVAYGFVAIPAQTQLQEDLPEEVRGRVFGVLNMLVSVASFVPIIIVGPISDLFNTPLIIFIVAVIVGATGVASIALRGPLRPAEAAALDEHGPAEPLDPLAIALHADPRFEDDTAAEVDAGADRHDDTEQPDDEAGEPATDEPPHEEAPA
jgi:MFS family permease